MGSRTKEPGGTASGGRFVRLVLQHGPGVYQHDLSKQTELLLYGKPEAKKR